MNNASGFFSFITKKKKKDWRYEMIHCVMNKATYEVEKLGGSNPLALRGGGGCTFEVSRLEEIPQGAYPILHPDWRKAVENFDGVGVMNVDGMPSDPTVSIWLSHGQITLGDVSVQVRHDDISAYFSLWEKEGHLGWIQEIRFIGRGLHCRFEIETKIGVIRSSEDWPEFTTVNAGKFVGLVKQLHEKIVLSRRANEI